MSATLLAAPARTPHTPHTPHTLHTLRISRASPTSDKLPIVVSATSLDVDGEVRAMVRPRVPNYALRRMFVGGLAVVALACGLVASVGLLAAFSGTSASASASASAGPGVPGTAPTVHVAQPGDTLWSIAAEHRGDVDRDRYIDALIRLNGGTAVQAGSAVWLP